MIKSRPTITTTTPMAIPMARQFVSRSSAAGFGWMNPPIGGFYYWGRMWGDTVLFLPRRHRDREITIDSGGRTAFAVEFVLENRTGQWCHHPSWGPSTAFGWRLTSLRMTA